MQAEIKNSTQKLVLLKLADCASDTGECFPSYQHIADQCKISRRAVINIIKKLQEDDFLTIEKRCYCNSNKSNIYKLTIEKGNQRSERNSLGVVNGGSLGVVNDTSLGSERNSLGGSEPRSPITSNSLEPVNETNIFLTRDAQKTENANFENANNSQNENFADKNFSDDFADQKTETRKSVLENPDEPKKTKTKNSRLETELKILADIGVIGQVAIDHLQMRHAKRLPLTKTAAKQLKDEAEKCGLTPQTAIELAIGYGWCSFRAEWLMNKQRGYAMPQTSNSKESFFSLEVEQPKVGGFVDRHGNPIEVDLPKSDPDEEIPF